MCTLWIIYNLKEMNKNLFPLIKCFAYIDTSCRDKDIFKQKNCIARKFFFFFGTTKTTFCF